MSSKGKQLRCAQRRRRGGSFGLVAFGGGERQRGKARGGGLQGKCATVPSAREGAMDMGSWGRFSQIPWRDGVAGAGGPFARGVGGTFRTIAFGFGGRFGAR